MRSAPIAVCVSIIVLLLPTLAAQTAWDIDPSHSAAQFQVRHLMISNVRGEFGRMSGKVLFDGRNYATVQAEATIEVASINTREPDRDKHLRSADFFDAAAHPRITFKSKRVEAIHGNTFNLVGDLTLRGATREIVLRVEATPVIKGMRGETRLGAQATTRLNRQDYGIRWNRSLDAGGVVVGNDVHITLDLELIRK